METRFFEFNGARMAYSIRDGTYPLVLIHGFTASSEIWEPLIDELDNSFKLILVDLFGHGKSELPGINLSLADVRDIILHQAKAIAALMKNLDIIDYGLVGSSLGGWVSMELAVNHTKPSGLVLIDTAGVVPLSDPDFKMGLSLLVQLYNSEENVLSPVLTNLLDSGNDSSTLMNKRLIEEADFPVKVIWGTEDPVLKVNYGKKFSSELKYSEFTAIGNAGHTPFTTNPKEVANLINNLFR